jgi:hypothetical protein
LCRVSPNVTKATSFSLDWNRETNTRGRRGWHVCTEERRKRGTSGGSRSSPATARGWGINRHAAKSSTVHQWGGWGRLSDEEPYSKSGLERGPLGPRGRTSPMTAYPSTAWDSEPKRKGYAKGRSKQRSARGMLGESLSRAGRRKALPDMSALKPYRGKPAVRNFRGVSGNRLRHEMRHRRYSVKSRQPQLLNAHQHYA